ncbi:translocation/assembly module TamB domain-containing protein [Nitrosophilus kaiyonis]|uniref:translocation/assembly module TamB domain-containing protein n=1 Tax=Nitrosophilus kaiyonis TaxID=2930200 RepID=UPI0024913795|nr:translocation/assembly module TamB domain-containing protein [Nitrosophilus kaiyonis]
MKKVFFIIEIFLLVILTFFVLESKEKILENFIKYELLKYKISTSIKWNKIDNFIFENIKYKKDSLSSKIDIFLDYRYFLNGVIGFKSIKIDNLNINNLFKIKTQKSSSKFFIPIFIKKINIDSNYRFKNKNSKIFLYATDIKIKKDIDAKIKNIKISTFWFDLKGSGKIKKNVAYLDSKTFLKKSLKIEENILEKLNPIISKIVIDKTKISFDSFTKIENLYNFKKINANLAGKYIFKDKKLSSKLKAKFFRKNINIFIDSNINYKNSLKYNGICKITNNYNFENIKDNIYKKIEISFLGNEKKVEGKIKNLPISFNIKKEKNKFVANIKSDKIFIKDVLKKYPSDLKEIYLLLNIDAKFFKKADIKFNINSNIASIKGEYLNKTIKSKIFLSDNFSMKYNIKKDFSPIDLNIKFQNSTILVYIKNSYFSSKIKYDKLLQADLNLLDTVFIKIYSKNLKEKLYVNLDIPSFFDFYKKAKVFYPLPNMYLDSKLDITLDFNIKKLTYSGKIHSPWLVYEYKKYNYFALTYLLAHFNGDLKTFIIDYYALALPNHSFFATKSSKFEISQNNIKVKEFWIEDKIKIEGFYNLFKDGRFFINAKDYRYSSVEGIAKVNTNLQADINKKNIYIQGDIFIKDAQITYNPRRIKTIEDEDIIIIDKEKPVKSMFFKNFVGLNIHIYSKKPLFYHIKDLNALILPDITIWKEYQKDLQLLGMVEVLKGKYTFGNKIFKIKKSDIDFYGPPKNPMLNLLVEYEKDEYTIFIKIVNNLQNPIILFESEPYLSQNDILSLILFDSKLSSLLFKSVGSEKFTGIFSNFFVKDLIESFGLKLDKFSLITSENRIGFEIGKKIAEKITVLYKNDQISTIVIRYKIKKNLQSEITISPEVNSFDLYYKIEK